MAQYILPAARNTKTGQTVKHQDLKGIRYQPHQITECQLMAQRLANNMTTRGTDLWVPVIKNYTA